MVPILFLDQVVDLNEPLPLADNSFDSILLTDVFAHVAEPHQLMREFSRVLKPGGHLCFDEPIFFIGSVNRRTNTSDILNMSLQRFCDINGLEVCELSAYGGRIDVILDLLNKKMTGNFRIGYFYFLATWYKQTSWYKKRSEGTRDKIPR